MLDGDPWFVATDVTDAIGADRTQTRRLDDDEKGRCSIHTPSGEQEMTVINEPGLYSLILGSRKACGSGRRNFAGTPASLPNSGNSILRRPAVLPSTQS